MFFSLQIFELLNKIKTIESPNSSYLVCSVRPRCTKVLKVDFKPLGFSQKQCHLRTRMWNFRFRKSRKTGKSPVITAPIGPSGRSLDSVSRDLSLCQTLRGSVDFWNWTILKKTRRYIPSCFFRFWTWSGVLRIGLKLWHQTGIGLKLLESSSVFFYDLWVKSSPVSTFF